jgi:hypothetical protein
MMSVNDFFESGSEPVWLVDACGEEIVSINSELGFADLPSTSSAYSGFNHGTEAGPSNSPTTMDFDEVNVPNVQTFFDSQNLLRNLGRSLQNVSSEQRRLWVNTAAPARVPTRRFVQGPATDIFRDCKKRKRS